MNATARIVGVGRTLWLRRPHPSRRAWTAMIAVTVAVTLGLAAASWQYSLPSQRSAASEIQLLAAGHVVATITPSQRAQIWVPLERIPPTVVAAVLAAEDRRFWAHPGIDPVAVSRAVLTNVKSAEVREGASTLSQQLARTLFLDTERTWSRKVREAAIALLLEVRYSKSRILEAYLNSVYLGHDGEVAVHGVPAAAQRFFGKDVAALELHEAAWLAGAIRAPNVLLASQASEARRRRDAVVQAMQEAGAIDPEAARRAVAQPLSRRAPDAQRNAPYFVDTVARELARRADLASAAGRRVETTLDLPLQRVAESAVRDGIARIERGRPHLAGKVQAAVVAIEPATGSIRVLVGGRGYRETPFNRATRAMRQPGSLFKPFVYLAAFEAQHRGLTPASLLSDEPLLLQVGGQSWQPRNLDRQFHGPVTVRRALEESLNIPAVRLAMDLGPRRVAETAQALGIEHPLSAVPSLALGTSEVSLLEITAAFSTIANRGTRVAPTTIAPVTGEVALTPLPGPVRAVSSESAFLTTHLLRGVMRRGTGAGSASWGLQGVTAGKTGSSDNLRDAWFVGYTPDLAVGVWVGLDDSSPLGLTGSQAALPIWGPVMQSAVRRARPSPFVAPVGITFAEVDRQTGRPVSIFCGSDDVVQEAFRDGTVPGAECDSVVATAAARVWGLIGRLLH